MGFGVARSCLVTPQLTSHTEFDRALATVGGVLWFTLGERSDVLGGTQVGIGPQGAWLRGRF